MHINARHFVHLRYAGAAGSRGIAAIILVIWTSLALAGLMFSLSEDDASLMAKIRDQGRISLARSAALACKEGLILRLMEEPRRSLSLLVAARPDSNGGGVRLGTLPSAAACGVDTLAASECHGLSCCQGGQALSRNGQGESCVLSTFGITYSAKISGVDGRSGVRYHLALGVLLVNDPPYAPFILYSRQVDE